jgi:hypothetical protein
VGKVHLPARTLRAKGAADSVENRGLVVDEEDAVHAANSSI